jgi:hypothetical protein
MVTVVLSFATNEEGAVVTMVKPISPHEVLPRRLELIPPIVFEIFNELITKNFDGRRASVAQCDVVERLIAQGHERSAIYENRWLDIETYYKKAGWRVHYDKPAYNESYAPFFVFEA